MKKSPEGVAEISSSRKQDGRIQNTIPWLRQAENPPPPPQPIHHVKRGKNRIMSVLPSTANELKPNSKHSPSSVPHFRLWKHFSMLFTYGLMCFHHTHTHTQPKTLLNRESSGKSFWLLFCSTAGWPSQKGDSSM